MQEVHEPLEDFVRRHKTRKIELERRFKEMMELAMKCDNHHVLVSRRQMTPDDIDYLRAIPGLTVCGWELVPGKSRASNGWKISW